MENRSPILMINRTDNFQFVAGQTYCTGIVSYGCETITIKEIITDANGQRFAVITSKDFIITKHGEKIQSREIKTVKRKIKTQNFENGDGTYESIRLGQTQYNGRYEKKADTVMSWCTPNLVEAAHAPGYGRYIMSSIDC